MRWVCRNGMCYALAAMFAVGLLNTRALGDVVDLTNADVDAGEDGKLEINAGDYGA